MFLITTLLLNHCFCIPFGLHPCSSNDCIKFPNYDLPQGLKSVLLHPTFVRPTPKANSSPCKRAGVWVIIGENLPGKARWGPQAASKFSFKWLAHDLCHQEEEVQLLKLNSMHKAKDFSVGNHKLTGKNMGQTPKNFRCVSGITSTKLPPSLPPWENCTRKCSTKQLWKIHQHEQST